MHNIVMYNIAMYNNFEGLKLLTRMRLGLGYLADHKFRHNFQDCLNPICSCGHNKLFPSSLSQLPLCKKRIFWENWPYCF